MSTYEGKSDAMPPAPVPVAVLGWALSSLFVVSYLICLAGSFLLPGLPIAHAALATVLPGFRLESPPTYILGFFESAVWGWYIALVFGWLFNFFGARMR